MSRVNVRRVKPRANPPDRSTRSCALVCSSAGRIRPVTQAAPVSVNASAYALSHSMSTSTSSSVNATISPVTAHNASLWARASPGRGARR